MELKERLQELSESIPEKINETNKLWRGFIRLIITLSSSFLVLTITFVKILFPDVANLNDLPSWLVISWVAFFSAIYFGLITEIDETIFHGNSVRKMTIEFNEIETKISNGIIENVPRKIKGNTIVWGGIALYSFLIAVPSLCVSLLKKIWPISNFIIIIALVVLIAIPNICFYLKRIKDKI